MPGFDRTGPTGLGPMTGGARGLCNRAATGIVPPYATGVGFGRGLGFRHGQGGAYRPGSGRGSGYSRGFGRYSPAFYPSYTVNPMDELDFLKSQANEMKSALDAINKRIDSLTSETGEES